MQKDLFTLTRWNLEANEAPTNSNLMIVYKDETGDRAIEYIIMAWRTNDGEHWITEDREICANNILAWAPFPIYKDLFTI